MINTKQFKSRLVQDLAWVIASPPLVSGDFTGIHWWTEEECIAEFNDCLPALRLLDKNPQPLIDHIAQLKSKRLGLRFESYLSYWLEISPNYKQLAKNIQVIEEGHTYGELDFIIQNIHSKKVIHLEVAVKFYLGAETPLSSLENPYHWFGTNIQDQLGLKLNHLKELQTQLSIKYQDYIQQRLEIHVDERHCLLKGRLFYPMNQTIPPKGVTKNHLRGHWNYKADQSDNTSLYPIEKIDWLAPLDSNSLQKIVTEKRLEHKHIACHVQIEQESGHYLETDRVFVLPNDFWSFL